MHLPNYKFKYRFLRRPLLKQNGEITIINNNTLTPINNIHANFSLKAQKFNRITPKHIEIGRRLITKYTRKIFNKNFINIFPTIPLSKKPLQTRMGKGKGRPKNTWITFVRPGLTLFSVQGFLENVRISKINRAFNFKFPMLLK